MDSSTELQMLRQENEILRRENETYRRMFLRYTMERAVGDEHLSADMAARMEQFYPNPPGPYYCMLLFHGRGAREGGSLSASPISTVSSAFRDVLSAYGQPFFFETIGTVCCLLNLSAASREEALARWERLTGAVESSLKSLSSVSGVRQISVSAVSALERGPRMLYRDAASVYARRTAASPPVCVSEAEPAANAAPPDNRMSLEPLFWKQVQQQRFFDAASTLDRLIELSLLNRVSLEQTLGAVFMRMEAVLQIATQTGSDPGAQNEFTALLSGLSQSRTYYEIRTCAYDILALLEDRVYTPENARNRKMPAIERYIQAHYADTSLGTASISEEFRISTSYLARIFKADRGVSVTDYIHSVRIDAAKELLQTTTLTLDEIAARVGFSNRWVLIRIFKSMMGITPGQFKEAAT